MSNVFGFINHHRVDIGLSLGKRFWPTTLATLARRVRVIGFVSLYSDVVLLSSSLVTANDTHGMILTMFILNMRMQ